MPNQQRSASPDVLSRKVLFAVELLDPIAQDIVRDGVSVAASGLAGRPIVNRSGRFVWLVEGAAWPVTISVTPLGAPFLPQTVAAPAPPADPDHVPPAARLLRIVLRPSTAYPFEAGTTALRGRLCEQPDAASPGIAGVRVQLAWRDTDHGGWHPPPPEAATEESASSPGEVETDANGEFAVFVRTPPPPEPDVKKGLLKVRLQFARRGGSVGRRVTPENFPFLPQAGAGGRIVEGQLLARDLRLAWSQLDPV